MNNSKEFFTVSTASGYAGAGFINGEAFRLWLPEKEKSNLLARISEQAPGAREIKGGSLAQRIAEYFEGEPVEFPDTVLLDSFDEFPKKVFQELRRITRGETMTYAQLAARCGKPKAARYVGSIMGKNPVPLIIPCHRVVRSDGSPGGFTTPAGPSLKIKMLELERSGERAFC
ncbi:Methylated-DNA--protein-cysteine methyltransferase [hydrothermal vent metagenome]|uniref:methylated-DNA--[protein]-cysteine S-methyltransferase n=1 Tax=hydrothermal vent metagenome TaxID=652676 RepID=A0A3B1CVW5_9ZZZZ